MFRDTLPDDIFLIPQNVSVGLPLRRYATPLIPAGKYDGSGRIVNPEIDSPEIRSASYIPSESSASLNYSKPIKRFVFSSCAMKCGQPHFMWVTFRTKDGMGSGCRHIRRSKNERGKNE